MGLLSGLFGSSKQTTSTNPYKGLPKYVRNYYQSDMARANAAVDRAAEIQVSLAANPEIISDLDPRELEALQSILAANELGADRIATAEDMLDPSYYENPYTEAVVDTTLDSMKRKFAQDAVLRGASEASFGGNSGTRSAIMAALAGDYNNRALAETEAGLRSDAFEFGVGAGQQGAQIMAGLAESDFDREASTAAALGTYGAMDREIRDKRANAQRTAGADALSWYADIFNATRQLPATGGGSTTQPGPSVASQALGAGATAAGIWSLLFPSDRRAKKNIRVESGALDKLRELEAYSYEYEDGIGYTDQRTSGLMTDDLRRSGIIGAVHEAPDGIERVDPYPVLATVVAAVKELDARTRPGTDPI